ncbi:MAG: DUF4827 domain-containing protein [Muribaculaceae bacterium]|nr:DUF4827 domain-containing protein [Muribaculaceae bacterium]
MKNNRIPLLLILLAVATLFVIAGSSCNDSKSYAELLTDETHNVNAFLANQRVINEIPADSVFEVGPNAPYYRIEREGNIYMQVLSVGDGGKVKPDQQVYFRYTRYDLSRYAATDSLPEGAGNSSDMEYEPTWFRFQNYTLTSSAQYGAGIQMPLNFLQYNAEVNLVVKSQYGFTSEISYVCPFLYNIRYFKGQI